MIQIFYVTMTKAISKVYLLESSVVGRLKVMPA